MNDIVLCEFPLLHLPIHAERALGPNAATAARTVESASPFCLKVRRALHVAGLPFTSRFGARPAVFKALNPTGQVPVLLVDGAPVCDSTPILARIRELAPTRFFHSPEALLWEELADVSLNGFLVAARWADADNWPRVRATYFAQMPRLVEAVLVPRLQSQRVKALIARDVWRAGPEACWARLDELLDSLEARAPRTGLWLSDAISAADLGLFGQLHSLRSDLTPRQRDMVEARVRLTSYLDRVDDATRRDERAAQDVRPLGASPARASLTAAA